MPKPANQKKSDVGVDNTLNGMPNDIKREIASHLESPSDLLRLSIVSKSFNKALDKDSVWTSLGFKSKANFHAVKQLPFIFKKDKINILFYKNERTDVDKSNVEILNNAFKTFFYKNIINIFNYSEDIVILYHPLDHNINFNARWFNESNKQRLCFVIEKDEIKKYTAIKDKYPKRDIYLITYDKVVPKNIVNKIFSEIACRLIPSRSGIEFLAEKADEKKKNKERIAEIERKKEQALAEIKQKKRTKRMKKNVLRKKHMKRSSRKLNARLRCEGDIKTR